MSTTALDQHRDANSAPGALDAALAAIEEYGVEFVYFQAVTITARVVGKVIPADQFARLATRGVMQHRTAIANLQTTREGVLLGGGVEAHRVLRRARPRYLLGAALGPQDRTRLLQPLRARPRDGRSRRSPTDRHPRPDEATACRLHRSHRAGAAHWDRARDDLGRTRFHHVVAAGLKPRLSHRAPGAVSRDLSKVIAYAKFMGFQMVEGDFEDAGQVELNWMYDHSDATADRLMTYRQICKQVARELGIEASFMPKPGQGYMGNGCHHNF